MYGLPTRFRYAILALATLQLASGVAIALADGVARARDVVLAAHVEDEGATHNPRSHGHDCIACREMRTGYVAPPAPPALAAPEDRSRTIEHGPVVVADACETTLCARGPPGRTG